MKLTEEQNAKVLSLIMDGYSQGEAIKMVLGIPVTTDEYKAMQQELEGKKATNQTDQEVPAKEVECEIVDDKTVEVLDCTKPKAPVRPPAPARKTQAVVNRSTSAINGFTPEQVETIRNTVAKGASNSDLQMLLHIAATYGLDPFLKELYYSPQMKTIITSRDGYLKAAQSHPDFEGIQSMAVCENDDFALDVENCSVKHSFGKGERGKVIGAWACCYRRGRKPLVAYASFEEYKQNNNIWSKYKSAMICKVAEIFSLKRQFGISGMVTREEIDCGDVPMEELVVVE